MVRASLVALVALLVVAPTATAQTASQARVIRPAVIVDAPRGDAPVVTAVPPGVVIDLLQHVNDWYQVGLFSEATGGRRPAGWVHQETVELLPGQPPVPVTSVFPRDSRVAPAVTSAQRTGPGIREPALRPGVTELAISADMSGLSFAGETTSGAALSAIVGFVVPKNLEVVVVPEVVRAAGMTAGTIGAGLFVNFRNDGVVIPFAGGVVGTTFGTPDIAALNETQYIHVSGGFRVMTRGGGGSLIVRPYFQRYLTSSDVVGVPDINSYGLSIGASVLFGN